VGDPWDDEFQLVNSIALLSYPVHVHSHLRPLRQGLVHVSLITWEGCHIHCAVVVKCSLDSRWMFNLTVSIETAVYQTFKMMRAF
jgi:hypothetical protein